MFEIGVKPKFKMQYEVIVVDDGSLIGAEYYDELISGEKLRFCKKKHSGPAGARNYGISIAEGEFIVFIGDDIICEKDFIERHYEFLLKNENCASAGKTVWHRDTQNQELYPVLQNIGLGNFSTSNIMDCGFYSFTTSNIALPKRYLEAEVFDEKFPFPAVEDNELGYRLYKYGLKVKYNEKAIAYHKHAYTLNNLKKRQKELGYSIGYFIRKHPEIKNMYLKPRYYLFLSFLLKNRIFKCLGKYNKMAICTYEKYRGLKEFYNNVFHN